MPRSAIVLFAALVALTPYSASAGGLQAAIMNMERALSHMRSAENALSHMRSAENYAGLAKGLKDLSFEHTLKLGQSEFLTAEHEARQARIEWNEALRKKADTAHDIVDITVEGLEWARKLKEYDDRQNSVQEAYNSLDEYFCKQPIPWWMPADEKFRLLKRCPEVKFEPLPWEDHSAR